MNKIKCSYINDCIHSKNESKCAVCANNHLRNYIEDHFKKAEDNPIPDECPRLTYAGPAEQTRGYQCPVCNGYSGPYELHGNNLCLHCGYRLNI